MYSLYRNIPLKPKYKNLTLEQIELYPVKREAGDTTTITRDELYCWDKAKQRATRGFGSSESLNQLLNDEMVRADNILNDMAKRKKPLTADSFRKFFKKDNVDLTFYEYCDEQLITNMDGTLSKETVKSYLCIISKLENYKPGVRMEDVDFKFLNTYSNWLRREKKEGGKGNCVRTVNNNMKVIRTMMLLAIKNGDFLEEHYPFKDFKVGDTTSELTSRDFLEPEEILCLEKLMLKYYPPSKESVHQVNKKEWQTRLKKGILNPGEFATLKYFLFACYTGLRYRDMVQLDMQEHIKGKYVENPYSHERKYRYYIDVDAMHKTGKVLVVPLIDKAFAFLDLSIQGTVFNVISNQRTNSHLKHIAALAGINKTLTFHVARHTFATTCFTYGIPAEVGQKLLGHKSGKFIQVYTHLTQNRLFHEMDKVNKGFNDYEQLLRVVHRKDDVKLRPSDALIKKLDDPKFREWMESVVKLDDDKLDKIAAITKVVA